MKGDFHTLSKQLETNSGSSEINKMHNKLGCVIHRNVMNRDVHYKLSYNSGYVKNRDV